MLNRVLEFLNLFPGNHEPRKSGLEAGLKDLRQILTPLDFWPKKKYVLSSGEARLPARRQDILFFSRVGLLAGGSSQRGFPIGTQRIGPLPSQRRTQHTLFLAAAE